jgi:hypothetical protein
VTSGVRYERSVFLASFSSNSTIVGSIGGLNACLQ